MARLLGAAVAMVLGCSGGEMGGDAGDVADGADDARETDGVPPIDGPPGPCPYVLVPPAMPATSPPPPTQVTPFMPLRVTWRCIGGCATYPAPELTRATRLSIASSGTLTWSGGADVVHASTITGPCRRVASDDAAGCRAYFDVCSSGNGVSVSTATWFDVNTQWRQTWEATGMR